MSTLLEKQAKQVPFKTAEEKKAALEKGYALAEKTETFKFNNHSTKYKVKLALAQGFDEDGTDAGMNEVTGLVTIATDLKPGGESSVPIGHLNCRATKAECSISFIYLPTGQEGVYDAKDQHAPEGGYLPQVTFGIVDPTSFSEEGLTPPEFKIY